MSPAVNFRHQYARRVEERGAYSRKIADLDRQFFFRWLSSFRILCSIKRQRTDNFPFTVLSGVKFLKDENGPFEISHFCKQGFNFFRLQFLTNCKLFKQRYRPEGQKSYFIRNHSYYDVFMTRQCFLNGEKVDSHAATAMVVYSNKNGWQTWKRREKLA